MKEFFLYLIIFSTGGASDLKHRYAFPSEQACQRALSTAKLMPYPGEDEGVAAMFCAGEDSQVLWNQEWHQNDNDD